MPGPTFGTHVSAIIEPSTQDCQTCRPPALTPAAGLPGHHARLRYAGSRLTGSAESSARLPASAPRTGTLRPVVVAYLLALAGNMRQYRSSHICSNQPESFSVRPQGARTCQN